MGGWLMPVHTVRQGEFLAAIGAKYGFTDANVIWNHAENRSLRESGRTPTTLAPGDSVFVPDLVVRQLSRSTRSRQAVTVNRRPLRLRFTLQRLGGTPVAGASCSVRAGGSLFNKTSDADGGVELKFKNFVESGELVVQGEGSGLHGVRIPFLVGHLDPATEISGQEARLNALGYRAGSGGDGTALKFRSALEEFQCDEGLTVDGVCGRKTRARLVKVHGC